jgi:aspartyl-tRNA(Asn)/glutamyl-tRNA(Gln) amidotransferase subunit B
MIDDKKIGITRVHLEEDTGRLIHPEGADYNRNGSISGKEKYSLVDLNRAGIPLMELVTEPDLTSGVQSRKFAEELQQIFLYLGVSEANMEKGQMRVEVNISLTAGGKLGTKVEIKNLNSFRAVEKSIDYEITRQTEVLESAKKVIQETRGWDDDQEMTVSQREKEEAHDYRYFPEPDLPPLRISAAMINEIKAQIPELPALRRNRFKEEYALPKEEIEILVRNKVLGQYYEKTMSELRNWIKEAELIKEVKDEEFIKLAKICSNYLITDLQGLLCGNKVSDKDFKITPENFAEFITLIYEDKISSKIAKIVLEEMFRSGADPSHIIEEKDLSQISNETEIKQIVMIVMKRNAKVVEDFRRGKANAFQFLIGQIMIKTKGKASPQVVNKILKEALTKVD